MPYEPSRYNLELEYRPLLIIVRVAASTKKVTGQKIANTLHNSRELSIERNSSIDRW